MAKLKPLQGFDRLLRKEVVFQGKLNTFHFGSWRPEQYKNLVEAQQGTVADSVSDKTAYLVVPDLNKSKTAQKTVLSLNAKGAAIQVIDSTAFENLVAPTPADLLTIIRAGKDYAALFELMNSRAQAQIKIDSENFDRLDAPGFNFSNIAFHHCSFVDAVLNDARFGEVTGCKFTNAKLKRTIFYAGSIDVDFSGADLESASLSHWSNMYRATKKACTGFIMTGANLTKANLNYLLLDAPNLDRANLTNAQCVGSSFQNASMVGAVLQGAAFSESKLQGANFTHADLQDAAFGGADLSNACFDHANLADVDFAGTTLTGAKLDLAKNYSTGAKNIGPALTELNQAAKTAGRIEITFQVRKSAGHESEKVGIDTEALTQYGWGIMIPDSMAGARSRVSSKLFSDAMARIVKAIGKRQILFETLEIETRKASKSAKELRDVVIAAIAEASGQQPPPAELLEKTTKKYRDTLRAIKEKEKQQAKLAAEKAEKDKVKQLQNIEKKIEKAVGGKVSDVATFLKALELRIEKPKIDKATKMLKADGFKLFNDITETHVNGVVKSQTDPDLVYACRIEADGKHACCTQNLNVCGGLRGSVCKHLLVLIIGLVQAGELDPNTIDGWIAKSNSTKPELNKETMGEIFIRFKGAEAGEVDWRPTQTVPEDYYSL